MSSLLESSIATPTICRPWAPYCFCNSMNHGISILQGLHHVAQKFSRTALPRRSDRRMLLPSSDCSVKSGAGPDLVIGGGAGPERRAMWKPKYNIAAATTATTTKASGLRFPVLTGEGAEAPVSPRLPPSMADSERLAPQTSQVAAPKAPSRALPTGAPHFGHRSEIVDINQILQLQSKTVQERQP